MCNHIHTSPSLLQWVKIRVDVLRRRCCILYKRCMEDQSQDIQLKSHLCQDISIRTLPKVHLNKKRTCESSIVLRILSFTISVLFHQNTDVILPRMCTDKREGRATSENMYIYQ